MKKKIENIINEELAKYEFEVPQDEYSILASELAERLVKLFCQPAVICSVCDGCGSKIDVMDILVGVCFCCQKEIKQTDR